MIYLGADHGGFELKEAIKQHLLEQGYEVEDCGTHSAESVDYAPIAQATCEKLLADKGSLGILCCGTGIGMSLAANKVKGIRCAACSEPYSATMTRAHNDANMLAIGARVIGVEIARMIVRAFLETPFEGGRHQRRVDMLTAIENGDFSEK